MALSSNLWSTAGYFDGFIYGIQFLETFCVVAIFATAMNLSWTRVAATQFTLYTVCNNIGNVLGSMVLGPLRERLEWSEIFLMLAGLLIVVLVLWQFMRLSDHMQALGELESDFQLKNGKGSLVEDTGIPDYGVPLPVE